MKFKSFKKEFTQWSNKNIELVYQYEEQNGILIKQQIDVIYKLYNSLLEQSIVYRVSEFLTIIFNKAVETETPVLLIIEDLIKGEQKLVANPNLMSPIQKYFNEIKRIYDKHDNDFNIPFCEENREKLIEMNLKTVISVAKRFIGPLGMSLEELISIGNLGLCVAFDKFDPKRSRLQNNILAALEENKKDTYTLTELRTTIGQYLTYGQCKANFESRFNDTNKEYTYDEVTKWVKANIKNARFNSVAVQWIVGYIMQEYYDNNRIIKKPKIEVQKERTGESKREVFLDITGSVNGNDNIPLYDTLYIVDESKNDVQVEDANLIFKTGLKQLLTGVKIRDRRILLQRFGIGYPRPLEPKEIEQLEGISVARLSQIVVNTIKKMKANQEKYNIDKDVLMDAVSRLY